MTILKRFFILILVIGFLGCTTSERQTNAKLFLVEAKSLKADTVITSAMYFGEHIICLQEDHKIFVLDTSLNQDNNITAKFSNLKANFLLSYNDTVFIGTDREIFFINKNFKISNYSLKPFKYGLPCYNDDTYYVYACSAGEFGAAVFFWNKKTNKTYSYPATTVQQVFRFRDTFIVSNFLAHLSGFSDYLFIKDPTTLYELKDEKQKTFCNWYMEVDSIKDRKLLGTTTLTGVKYYSDSFTTRTLTTFPYKNEIFSIYCTDSATIIAKFQSLKLIPIDTLLPNRLIFHETTTDLKTNGIVTAYRATWAVGDEGNSWTPYQNTGLIFIRNGKITFLKFQTPHMSNENKDK